MEGIKIYIEHFSSSNKKHILILVSNSDIFKST